MSGYKRLMSRMGGKQVHIPPDLKEGQVRCPICRNAVGVTPVRGILMLHDDLTGYRCRNRRPDQEPVDLTELPPVNLPDPREPRESQRYVRKVVTGRCHTCDQRVSGARLYCGKCLARRMSRKGDRP